MSVISIIIPIFNGRHYIDSLIRQAEDCRRKLDKKDRLEVIFVNDDPSEKLPRYESSELIDMIFLDTDVNRGIHGARVRGLEISTGDYVLFLDQDDRIAPDYFSRQLECIGNHDAVVCQLLHEKKGYYNAEYPFERMMTKEYMLEKGSPIISPGQVLIRKTSIPDVWKKKFLQSNGADDFFLWLCMAALGCTFALNDEILFEHVVRYGNTSWNSYNMMRSEEEMVHILVQNGLFSREDTERLKAMLQEIQKKRLNNLDKFRKLFYVLKDLAMTEKEQRFEAFLKERKLYKIALYGGGYLGKYLLKRLENSGIQVCYLIDQNAAFLDLGYPTFRLEEELEEVDAVIVTLVQKEEAVVKDLRKKLRARIFTIRELTSEWEEETIW